MASERCHSENGTRGNSVSNAERDENDEEELFENAEREQRQQQQEEVVVKMEGVGDGEEVAGGGDSGDDGGGGETLDCVSDSTMKVEVFPKRGKGNKGFSTRQVNAAFKATESDDALRNIDVLVRLRTIKRPAVMNWIFNHDCCPEIYKQNAETPEGRRIATVLLTSAFARLKKNDVIASKQQCHDPDASPLKLRLAPFVFPPWRRLAPLSEAAKNKRAEIKGRREAEETRRRELRLSLAEKEERLKRLVETKELPPPEDFLKTLKTARRQKEKSLESMTATERELNEARARLDFYAGQLPDLRKRRKSRKECVKYYERQMAGLEAVGPKLAAAERNRAFAAELLRHEREALKIVREDGKSLRGEKEEMEFALEEYREGAVFDGMDVTADPPSSSSDTTATTASSSEGNKKKLSTKYRADMLRIINELIESGLDAESMETLFESVFQCVDSPVQGFPSTKTLKRIYKEYAARESRGDIE